MIVQAISAFLLAAGCVMMLIASIGILHLPDLYMRMSASTKAGTLGIGLLLLAALLIFTELGIQGRILAIIAFICITAPVAAHAISRAGYLTGSALWPGTHVDQLRGCYDPQTHRLASRPGDSRDEPGGG